MNKKLLTCIVLLTLCIFSTDQTPGSLTNCLIIATTGYKIIQFKQLIKTR